MIDVYRITCATGGKKKQKLEIDVWSVPMPELEMSKEGSGSRANKS